MSTEKEKFVYSDAFREAVLKAYPGNRQIKTLLNNNDYLLGQCLNSGYLQSQVRFSAEEILVIIGSGALNDFVVRLLELSNNEKLKSITYKMWDEETG